MQRALTASLLTSVLLALCASAPGIGVLLLPLLPLPFALVVLRSGPVPAIAVSVGLAIAGTAGTSGESTDIRIATVWFVVGATGVLALVLAACGIGRRFQTVPGIAMTVAYLAVLGVPAALMLNHVGLADTRHALERRVDSTFEQRLKDCGTSKRLAPTEDVCREWLTQRSQWRDAVRHHTLLVIVPTIALVALIAAAVSIRLLRSTGTRAGLAVHRPGSLVDLSVHWSVAYVLSAGLVMAMLGRSIGGDIDHPVVVAGTIGIAIGATALIAQGAAVLHFYLRHWNLRRPVRVIVWMVLVLMIAMATGWLLILGIAETFWGLRERTRKRIATRDEP
jgi:uncharacterized protein YybS (DUF2232 family)